MCSTLYLISSQIHSLQTYFHIFRLIPFQKYECWLQPFFFYWHWIIYFCYCLKKQIQLEFTRFAVVFYIWVKALFYFSYLKINIGSVKVSFRPHSIHKNVNTKQITHNFQVMYSNHAAVSQNINMVFCKYIIKVLCGH